MPNNDEPRKPIDIFSDDDFTLPQPNKQLVAKKTPEKPASVKTKKTKSIPGADMPTNNPLKAAEAVGFQSRDPNAPKIDGRTLRRTGRTKPMMLKTNPETHQEMLLLTHENGYESMGHFLEELIRVFKNQDKN